MQWSFKTHKSKYWSVADDGSVSAATETRTEREWFNIEWFGAKIAIKAYNGKYLLTKGNGSLSATGTSNSAIDTLYIWEIINRPRLVLRGEHGFIGTLPSGVLECNKSSAEVYTLQVAAGVSHISGSNGKYWQVNGDNITVNGDKPTDFDIELVEHSKAVIKYQGKYLQGSQAGGYVAELSVMCFRFSHFVLSRSLKFSGSAVNESTLWEY